MVRVRGPVVFPTSQMYHETVLAKYLDENIASWHAACFFEQLLDDQVQFGASKTRIILPVVLGFLDYEGFYRVLGKVVVIPFIVRLPAITKQPAKSAQTNLLALFT